MSLPTYTSLVVDEQIEIPVQVNGKLVSRVTVGKDAPQADIRAAAMRDTKVAEKLSA